MAPIVMSLRQILEDIMKALTAQGFGMQYELACTELSLQWVRIHLWGEAAGLNLSEDLDSSLLFRPDIEPTIATTIECMMALLTEIECLRFKYQSKKAIAIPHVLAYNNKSLGPYGARDTPGVPISKPNLKQRLKHHEKKSIFTKAKWALRDERRFNDKLKALRGYVDALESITRAIGFTTFHSPGHSTADTNLEGPPPYSVASVLRTETALDYVPGGRGRDEGYLEEAPGLHIPGLGFNPSILSDAAIIQAYRMATRRYGCIFPPGFSMCHHGYCLCSPRHSSSMPTPRTTQITRQGRSATFLSPGDVYTNVPLEMSNTTRDVLPMVLENYNITTEWHSYALCIVYGEEERCLGLEEHPLVVIEQLQDEGKTPMLVLRKLLGQDTETTSNYNVAQSTSVVGGHDFIHDQHLE